MVRLRHFPEYRRSYLPDPTPDTLIPGSPYWDELSHLFPWFRQLAEALPYPQRLGEIALIWWQYSPQEQQDTAPFLNALFPKEKTWAEAGRLDVFFSDSLRTNLGWKIPDNELCARFLGLLWPNREQFLFQVGFLTSYLPNWQWPPEILQYWSQLPHRLPHQLLPQFEGWFLCEDAEMLLHQAERAGAVALVDEVFYTKIKNRTGLGRVGKLASVALYDAATPNGLVLAGNWYQPVDGQSCQTIINRSAAGEDRITTPAGKWVLIRPFDYLKDPAYVQKKIAQWRGKTTR